MNAKLKQALYQLSALLILFAAIFYNFSPDVARYIMIIGVAGFGSITFTTPYQGKSVRGKRLFNIQIFAVIMMVVAAYLMFVRQNEWVVPLLISAILTLYSVIMTTREYEKEHREEKRK